MLKSYPGHPIHFHDTSERPPSLTRCGLWVPYLRKENRVTDDITQVDCSDCLAEGPAAAYVLLPDGYLIERRSNALSEYHFAIALLHETNNGPQWRLETWDTDIQDAHHSRDYRARGRQCVILPVLFAGKS